jgi:acetyl-CoA carboxylase biotin carboxyl carrier protein
MTLEEIKQLIDLANETGIAELELERGGNRVRIRRTAASTHHEVILPGAPAHNNMPAGHVTPAAAPAADASVVLVKAPIVGTFSRPRVQDPRRCGLTTCPDRPGAHHRIDETDERD